MVMSSVLNRRELLAGLGAAAGGSAAVPEVSAGAPTTVRGAWLIQPATAGGRASFGVRRGTEQNLALRTTAQTASEGLCPQGKAGSRGPLPLGD
jgi:hypothetical protein